MAASITTRLEDIEQRIDAVVAKLESDDGASAALKAVVEELHRKTREACDKLRGADERAIREQLIEVEQAADSAKSAAEADEDSSNANCDAIIEIHDALSELKHELTPA